MIGYVTIMFHIVGIVLSFSAALQMRACVKACACAQHISMSKTALRLLYVQKTHQQCAKGNLISNVRYVVSSTVLVLLCRYCLSVRASSLGIETWTRQAA